VALAYIGLKYAWWQLVASEHGPPNPSTRLVLFVLALHMNKQGQNCYPSQARIARQTSLSERAVRHHLKLAERDGWLTVCNLERKGKRAWFVHQYTPKIPDAPRALLRREPGRRVPAWLRAADPAGSRSEAPPEHQRPANDAGTPGNLCQNGRHELPTNLSLNLPLNIPETEPPQGGRLGCVVEKLNGKPAPEPEAIRTERIRKAIAGLPDFDDDGIAAAACVTVEEVRQVRLQ
jgi:hypothetical protein